ncbi:MAG: glycosyltransferase [Bacteroidales bacterium]|nr:glycosyltransferase [Bacteroidales bacterium]
MIKNIFLHIGVHKTASTTIQNTLYIEREKLAEAGVLYPEFKAGNIAVSNHSIPFYSLFSNKPEGFHFNVSHGFTTAEAINHLHDEYRQQLETQIAGFSGNNLIISGEDISLLGESGLRQLRDYLIVITQPRVTISVVMLARHPVTKFRSALQGSVCAFGKPLENATQYHLQRPHFYRNLIAAFSVVFGCKSIVVLKYEEAISHPFGTAGAFLELVDKDLPDKIKPALLHHNPTRKYETFVLLNAINQNCYHNSENEQQPQRMVDLNKIFSDMPGHKFMLPEGMSKKVWETLADDANWLCREFSLPEYQFVDEDLKPDADIWSRQTLDYLRNVLPDLSPTYRRIVLNELLNNQSGNQIKMHMLDLLIDSSKTNTDLNVQLSERIEMLEEMVKVLNQKIASSQNEINSLQNNNSALSNELAALKSRHACTMGKLFSLFHPLFLAQRVKQKIILSKHLRLIHDSGLFDESYYLKNNPDVKESGMNAVKHFLKYGWKEGRNPSSLFDISFYLLRYADVKESGGNPLVHYLLYGKTENRLIKNTNSVEELKARWKAKKYDPNDEQHNGERLKFKGSASLLFIGHDGGIGGGQILLLSLVKWFHKKTGFDLKIILLTGGELVEKYHAIAPTMVWDECEKYYPVKDKFSETIREFIGKVDLVYGNTVVSSIIYDELSYLNVPVITHVHELEKTIRMYESTSALKNMRHFTSQFLVASYPVAENLIRNHEIAPGKIMMVPDFIETRDLKFDSSKNELRKKLGLPKYDTLVIGAGSITWRKGVDLFIETAIFLKQKGITEFHFIWIGNNCWEVDRSFQDICTWDELEQKIISNNIKNHISFLNTRDNFYEYFLAGDIFFLSSREDPFPLVCLEAAQCSIPVICFEKSGGMPDFVSNDAGFVVPYEDVNAVAEKIVFLQNHPSLKIELGAKARNKFMSGYTIDISAPKILNQCLQVANLQPVVSVIVPNYNYAKYLDQRLSSIYNQTFKEFEVIIMDDASTDDSLTIIEKYSSKPNTSVVVNKVNSGSIFRQWQKGIGLAKGKLIWIAESDDFSDPDFLAQMLPFFNHPEVALAHCNSNIVDDNNNITGDYTAYHLKLDFNHWKYDYRVKSTQEINFGLGVKNSILNVSSVIFRKEAIPPDIFNKLEAYRFSGDWLFYIELLKGRQIAYCSEKLNFHRRHSQTLTTQFTNDEQKRITLLKEAAKIHTRVLDIYEITPHFAEKWKFYIHEQIGAFYPNSKEEDFDKYYPYEAISTKIEQLTARAEAGKKRWVFLTTNDGASMGGSEKLWIQAALHTKKRGDEVMVVIKKWEPEPDFINDLRVAGIKVLFKKHFDFSQIVDFNPHLMIISIGDQEEGIEWYELCNASKIPYVILNQLTKEPMYWPVNEQLVPKLIKGQEDAEIVLFTGENNLRVMEKRLGHPITNSGIFYNPTGLERNIKIPYPEPGEKLQIAIVGNLHNIHKGQQLAIELFAKQKWRNRPVHLNIYGKGQDEDELKKQAQNLHLSNVTFCGFANDLAEVWKQNHAILLSSFMEGLPIVLMSAMLCARVSIATDIGSHTEVISDNVSGFIASKPSVDALDEALERAWQRKDEWKMMGIEARNAILDFLPENPMGFFINRIELFSMGNS